jgi:hypothetical protein
VALPSPAFPSRVAGASGSDRRFCFFSDDRFPKKVVKTPKPEPMPTGADVGSYGTLISVSY